MRTSPLFKIAFGVLPVFAVPLAAQNRITEHNLHGWYSYFGDHPLGSSKWGAHLEGQYRRHDAITRWQQLMIRPAVNYQANPVLMLTGGYAYVRTYPYGEIPAVTFRVQEHRLWEQAWFRYGNAEKTAWSTRIRFENRFLEKTPKGSGYRYENRLRMWQQATVRLKGRWSVTGYDELWFYVPPYVSNSAFDQNRAYVALARQLSPSLRLEAGYMNQLILQRSGRALESNHTIMVSLFGNRRIGR